MTPTIEVLIDKLKIEVSDADPDDPEAVIRTDCKLLPGAAPIGEGKTISESIAVLFARCIAQGGGPAPHNDWTWVSVIREALRNNRD